jgi:hypothetical protein
LNALFLFRTMPGRRLSVRALKYFCKAGTRTRPDAYFQHSELINGALVMPQESGSKTSGIERNTSSRQTENTTAKQKLNKTLETEVQGYLASKELQPPK